MGFLIRVMKKDIEMSKLPVGHHTLFFSTGRAARSPPPPPDFEAHGEKGLSKPPKQDKFYLIEEATLHTK